MSSSFKFHSAVPEIIPWQAQYNFPSQSNKVRKQTVKLVPKNGYNFSQNQIVRFEFPADGYCNMLNTALSFDVNTEITGPTVAVAAGTSGTAGAAVTAIHQTISPPTTALTPYCSLPRGGGHNYFKRVRVLYGSLVLEDIQEYKTLTRMFTEMGVPKGYQATTGSILEGHSESAMRNVGSPFTPLVSQNSATVNESTMMTNAIVDNLQVQQTQVGGPIGWTSGLGPYTREQASNTAVAAPPAIPANYAVFTDLGSDIVTSTATSVSNNVTRTFTIQLLTGLTSLKKLLPLKWMASQLVIELTIAPVSEVYVSNLVTQPTITLKNMNMVTELLEFDSSYDLAFFEGLNQPTGVPLKFTSWHYHQFAITGATQTYQIHERSRSVKSAFAVIRQLTPILGFDADWFFHNINDQYTSTLNTTAPTCTITTTPAATLGTIAPGTVTTSGVNSVAFQRGGSSTASTQAALTNNTLANGSTILNACQPVQQYQWRIGGQYYPAQPVRVSQALAQNANNAIARGEEAYLELMKAVNSLGDCTVSGGIHFWNYTITGTTGMNGEGSKFIMGTSFETPGLGPESINGINAEEQSDLALTIYGSQGGPVGTAVTNAKKLEVFVNYDCMLLVRAGNVVDLVL